MYSHIKLYIPVDICCYIVYCIIMLHKIIQVGIRHETPKLPKLQSCGRPLSVLRHPSIPVHGINPLHPEELPRGVEGQGAACYKRARS